MAVGGQLLSAGELMLPLDLPCTVTVPLYITKQNQALQLFREYFYAPDAQLFLFLFLDVGGDSLAGVFSTGSVCLFSYLCTGAVVPCRLRMPGHGCAICPDRSNWRLHR